VHGTPAAARTVTAVVAAGAARSAAYGELPQQHGKFRFEDLRVRESRVGHVSLYGVAAVELRTRAGTAGDRFVVLEPVIAESQIVHGAL